MQHIKLIISISENYQEALIAELDELGFEGYQQFDNEIFAFVQKKDFEIGDRERIHHLLAVYPGDNFVQTEEIVAEQNWNLEWEKSIKPQSIGPFLVKPTWLNKKPENDQILLEIDPKMAFGTGYHATTRLMLMQLPDLITPDITILDAGTGTGILAIAAVKLGAAKVVAFDNDEWSIKNTKENLFLNTTKEQVDVRLGSIEVVKADETFDVILANINKNIILKMLKPFQERLKPKGMLLLSGLLKTDEKELKQRLNENGLLPLRIKQEEEWIAILAEKC